MSFLMILLILFRIDILSIKNASVWLGSLVKQLFMAGSLCSMIFYLENHSTCDFWS